MSASWFVELAGIKTVGVTGTRGKTTVTRMLEEIMERAGMPVILGGNIRGVSTLSLLEEVTPESIALLELDSWQLQGFGDAAVSPHVAVFTTFMPDHLNYYTSMDEYLHDKAQIFLHQQPGDVFVLGAQAEEAVLARYQPSVPPTVTDEQAIPGWDIPLPGTHNRYNAALAVAAAKALGINEDTCKAVLAAFKGVPGRLELAREVNGVKFYNDTTATTPDATVAALRALNGTERSRLILIAGGMDKGSPVDELKEELTTKAKTLIFLAGNGTDRLRDSFPDAPVYGTFRGAFTAAVAAASPGDIVLLSPGFSSKNMFVNEYDRGDQFNAMVNAVPDLELLKPKVKALAEALVASCKKEGIKIVISRGFRSVEEQDALFAKGRTAPGEIITMAKGGQSFHNYGVAFDVRPSLAEERESTREEVYRKVGAVGKRLGLAWGGDWKEFLDLPHFEYTAGYSIEDFRNNQIDEARFAL
jgi:UDP-N-acetylmuramoylalanine--D-glutamate ligase